MDFNPIALIDEMLADVLAQRLEIEQELDTINKQLEAKATNSSQLRNEKERRLAELNKLIGFAIDYEKLREKFRALQLQADRTTDRVNLQAAFEELNKESERKRFSRMAQRLALAAKIVKLKWQYPIRFENGHIDAAFLSPEMFMEGETTDD